MCWRDEVRLVRACSTCGATYYGGLGHHGCPGPKKPTPEPAPPKPKKPKDLVESYINFVHTPPAKDRKTSTWAVMEKNGGAKIGEIRWFGRWRKYAFFPVNAIFEEACLREIASFIEVRTKEHRESAKAPF